MPPMSIKRIHGANISSGSVSIGSFGAKIALWCWRAQKVSSFEKFFSDHFASRGGLFDMQTFRRSIHMTLPSRNA